jgi:asparagine synthase (glutamine-hydrolysing)
MCGFAGFFNTSLTSDSVGWPAVLCRMGDAIRHRGPDSAGIWVDADKTIGLVHRRLAILELSPAGAQPMTSPCGRYVLIFNGEIYNHQDLRLELDNEGGAFHWRGHSDTETLLAGLRHWGIEKCLRKLIGMFAFALWDKSERTLFLARDRMGEKPLYYGRTGDSFLFASELKALAAHPAWQGEVDRDVLTLFLRFSYIPAPWSIYRGIFKLLPAHFVAITNDGRAVGQPVCYWNLHQIAEKGVDASPQSPEALSDELDILLRNAVKKQMAADVPLGAFLSGGYDSTTVAALMQVQSERPVKTFSIGFYETDFDEAIHAKKVAKHLGAEHTELYVTHQEAMSIIPKLSDIYDEPFSDVSQIPTYLVSQMARRQVTVSLSGDGGDELFCGYNRYVSGYSVWKKLKRLPQPARHVLAGLIEHAPSKVLDRIQSWLPKRLQVSSLADRLPKLADALAHRNGLSYYLTLVSHAKNPALMMLGAHEPFTLLTQHDQPSLTGIQEQMMFWDMLTYLPDDILTKVDRSSMAVSLEVRVPLLDHRVVEFAWRVPTNLKYRNGQGKWLLRQVLYRYVPKELMDRPKMGFGVPIEHWLRGPLRDWAESLLAEVRIQQDGYLDPTPIRQMWNEHLNGRRNWHYHLWDLLMLQSWLDGKKR